MVRRNSGCFSRGNEWRRAINICTGPIGEKQLQNMEYKNTNTKIIEMAQASDYL